MCVFVCAQYSMLHKYKYVCTLYIKYSLRIVYHIHTICPIFLGHLAIIWACWTSHFKTMAHKFGPPPPPLQLTTHCGCPRRSSTRIVAPSAKRAFQKSGNDLEKRTQMTFQYSSKLMRSGLCADHMNLSKPSLPYHVFRDLGFFTGAQSCHNRKGSPPNCCHNCLKVYH